MTDAGSRIRLENEKLSVVILPQLGGKIASFYHKDAAFELAAENTRRGYRLPSGPAPSFEDFDASGLDDAFPNIDACVMEWKGKRLEYPDHGEIWSHAFTPVEGDKTEETGKNGVGQQAALVWESSRFGYRYEKRYRLEGEKLVLSYRISSLSETSIPCIWTFHGLMRYEEDMRLLLPPKPGLYRVVSDTEMFGKAGSIRPEKDERWDFTRVPSRDSRSSIKYYAEYGQGEGAVKEGRCGLLYPSFGMRCMLEYDAEKLPCLGVWITAGGFRGDYNVALEPSNGFYDDIRTAMKNGCVCELAPGDCLEFSLAIRLEQI